MSPTLFKEKGFRFYFFSREEPRMHVHIHADHGEAKFWLEPVIALAQNHGLSEREVREIRRLIQDRADEIRNAWQHHFAG